MDQFFKQVYDIVEQIPSGMVASYGQIAGGIYADMRRTILEAGGVIFLPDGRVDMDLCRWFG